MKPANLTIGVKTTQQFTATALDQLGNPIAPQPSFIWTADANAGAINKFSGVLASNPTAGGPFTITATAKKRSIRHNCGYVGPASHVFFDADTAHYIGCDQQLDQIKSDGIDGSIWKRHGSPADICMERQRWRSHRLQWDFSSAGNIAGGPFTVTAAGQGFSAQASVSVFAQIINSILITPNSALIGINSSLQMTAVAYDQSGAPLNPQPTLTWYTSAGTISQTGLFTAGAIALNDTITVIDQLSSSQGSSVGSLGASVNVVVSSASILSFSTPSASTSPKMPDQLHSRYAVKDPKSERFLVITRLSADPANNYLPTFRYA